MSPARLPRLRNVEPALRRSLGGPCAMPGGSRVLVAVSGGADSTALLTGLNRLRDEFGLGIVAAHLNHGIRGAGARADQEFVRGLCRKLDVELREAAWNCPLRMSRRGLSGQSGLRRLRREFLVAAARAAGAVAVATAHTADDQLETLLMRMTRGTGLAGLAGIPVRRGAWIRPLLEVTRAEIEADLAGAGIEWREDPSNDDPAYLRNRIRHAVVPALRRAAALPEATGRSTLARHAARIAAEATAFRRATEKRVTRLLDSACRVQSGAVRLDPREVARCPAPVRRAVLGRCWSRLIPSHDGLTHRHLAALERLLQTSRVGSRLHLPEGVLAWREARWLCFEGPKAGVAATPVWSTLADQPMTTRRARRRRAGGNTIEGET